MFCRQMATEFNEEHQGDQPSPSAGALMESSAQLYAGQPSLEVEQTPFVPSLDQLVD